MEVAIEQFLILSGHDADPRQHGAPQQRTDQSKNRVFEEVHFHDAHGNADQVPDNREQAGHKNAEGALPRRPSFRGVDFGLRNQEIGAVT